MGECKEPGKCPEEENKMDTEVLIAEIEKTCTDIQKHLTELVAECNYFKGYSEALKAKTTSLEEK